MVPLHLESWSSHLHYPVRALANEAFNCYLFKFLWNPQYLALYSLLIRRLHCNQEGMIGLHVLQVLFALAPALIFKLWTLGGNSLENWTRVLTLPLSLLAIDIHLCILLLGKKNCELIALIVLSSLPGFELGSFDYEATAEDILYF